MDAAMDGLANKHNNNNNNITLSNCIIYASVYETARERKSLTSGHHRLPLDYWKEERQQEPYIYRYMNYYIKHYIVCRFK